MAVAVLLAGVEYVPALALGILEMALEDLRIGIFEIEAREFLLGLQEDVAIRHLVGAVAAVEIELIDVVDALDIHGEALEAISQLS
jgi:hypothetical protein